MSPKSGELSRRNLFHVLPAAACACAAVPICNAQTVTGGKSWSEPTGMSWQDTFRFAFQKDYIPLMKGLAERIGPEKFVQLIKETMDDVVRQKSARGPARPFDFAQMVAGMRNPPPFIQHTLKAEIVEDTPTAFGYKVTECLWAKTFRESNAAEIGYACICHPDFAIARGLSPKLTLTRTKTLMQGQDCCQFRYSFDETAG